MTADDRLAEITERLNAATRGPWSLEDEHNDYEIVQWEIETPHHPGISPDRFLVTHGSDRVEDAEFIANAPADIAWLIAELEKRDRKLAAVEALADSLVWKRPKVSPCAEYGFPCCDPEWCDAMQPSVSVVGHQEIRAALATGDDQ